MHICANCGKEFDGKFCSKCGLKCADGVICPDCGTKNKIGVKYCEECGRKLSDAAHADPSRADTKANEIKRGDRNERQKKDIPPVEDGVRPFLSYAYSNKKLQRASVLSYWCMLIATLTLFLLLVFLDVGAHGSYPEVISPHWIMFGCTAAIVLCVILSMAAPVKWTPESFLKSVAKKHPDGKGKLCIKRMIFYYVIWLIFIITTIFSQTENNVVLRGYVIADVYCSVLSVAYILVHVAVMRRNHAMAKFLYGQPAPIHDAELVIDYDEEWQIAAYNRYKEAVKSKRAKSAEPDVKKKLKIRKALLGVAAAVSVAVTVFAVVASPLLTDKFSASYVASYVSASSDEAGNSRMMFGESDEVTENRKNDVDEYIHEYFGDNYRSYHKRIKSIEEQIKRAEAEQDAARVESLYRQLAQAELQSSSIVFKYLMIKRVDSYDDDYKYYLDEVILDTNRCIGRINKRKSVKSVEISGAVSALDPDSSVLSSEIYYADGSYIYKRVDKNILSRVDTSRKGSQTVRWDDEYGSYSAVVRVA